MFNIGTGELVVIALIALIVLGPDKLPQAARQLGHYTSEARKIANGFRAEMKSAMDEVADTVLFLASDRGRYYNGAKLILDGGLNVNARPA